MLEPCFLLSEVENHIRDPSGNGWRYLEHKGGACVSVGGVAVGRNCPPTEIVPLHSQHVLGLGPLLGSRRAVGRGMQSSFPRALEEKSV